MLRRCAGDIRPDLGGVQDDLCCVPNMTNAPADEQIGCWNMVEKQYEEVECVAVK
jgi:hypothetical protein